MSDFGLSMSLRRRLLEGDYTPLVFRHEARSAPDPIEVYAGQVWERQHPPGLVVEVKRVNGPTAFCRLRRPGRADLPGLRPVPVALLDGLVFTLVPGGTEEGGA